MVKDVNYYEVRIDEQLSNNVYHYDRTSKQITKVTDEPEQLHSINNPKVSMETEISRKSVKNAWKEQIGEWYGMEFRGTGRFS